MNHNMEFTKRSRLLYTLFIFLILFFLNQYNQHGDYLYYKQVFFDINTYSFKEIWAPYFKVTERVFYYNAEPLFLSILKLFSLHLTYELFNSFTLFIFIYVYLNFILSIDKSRIALIIVLISSYYLWSLVLASEKNKISIIFLFLSLIFRHKLIIFFIFYYLAILIHSSMILYYFIILSFLYFYKPQFLLKFNFKKKLIIFIFFIIPIFFQYGFVVGKTIGYNEHEQRLIDKSDTVYQIENDRKIIINEDSVLNKLKFEKELKIFFYDLKLRYVGIDVANRSFSLIFNSEVILRLIFFYLFICFFSKKILLTIFSFSLVLIISSIIGISRFPIILFILIIFTFLDNYKYQFNNKNYLFTYALFLIFATWKMYKMIIQITNYGQIY